MTDSPQKAPAPLEASTESLNLSSSGVTAAPATNTVTKSADHLPRPMVTPNLDSKEAFEQFCQLYAPYMQYQTLFEREVR